LRHPDASEACSVYRYDEPEAAQLKYFLNYRLDEQLKEDILNACLVDLGFDERNLSRKLYMSRAQLKVLAESDSLGTHGHAHRALGLLSSEEARNDVKLSISKLQEWTGSTMKALSYPFGFYDACSQSAATAAQDMGVRFAFTMERGANSDLRSPMFLARYSNNDIFSKNGVNIIGPGWEIQQTRTWFR
jgi:peptidoglycan/xylan/chitin deacetylase (PgdA/CDA1 family)